VHFKCPWLTSSSFAEKVLKAAAGEKGIVEPSYVYLPGVPGGDDIAKTVGVEFFSVPIELGVSDIPRTEGHVLINL
jgi:malate dehydrogenase